VPCFLETARPPLFAAETGEQTARNAEIIFTNLPQSWMVFVLIGAVLALLFLIGLFYWAESKHCSATVRVVLAGLRMAVLFVLLAIFLGPAIRHSQERKLPSQILLLRDASQSMNTPDRYPEEASAKTVARLLGQQKGAKDVQALQPTRAHLVDEIFTAQNGRLIDELRKLGRVQIVDFSSNLKRYDQSTSGTESQKRTASAYFAPGDSPGAKSTVPGGAPKLADVAAGQATNLSRALQEALDEKQLAAIVLFTDGQHTESDNPVVLARQARERGVPLLIVGVGDAAPRKNLQVTEIYADRQVWKGAGFEVQALLRAEGFAGEDVNVELLEGRLPPAGGKPTKPTAIQDKTVRIPEGGGQLRVAFPHAVDIPGRRFYTVRVKPLRGEFSAKDNQPADPVEVNILQDKARVLLIAGGPSWEYRGVQLLLQNDDSVNLSCWMQYNDAGRAQDGNTIITRLPQTEEELLKYDVVLLFDPNPRDFDEKFVGLLQKFVDEKARGLLYLAGTKFSGRFLSGEPTKDLADLLPVTFGDLGAMEVAAMLQTNTRAWDLGVVAANVDHPIMRFYPEPRESMELWNNLPGIFWSFPAKSVKPGARVLIEHTDPTLKELEGPRPLLVTQRYGAGRAAYIGFNGTWRWKRVGGNGEFFARFWMQTIRFLIEGRLLEGKRRGYLITEKPRYQRKDTVVVTAEFQDAQSQPVQADAIEARLTVDGRPAKPVLLKPAANRPGHFQATLTALELGRHVLSVKLPDDPSAEPTMSVSFFVAPPSAEIRDLRMNKAVLQELAAVSGGKYFEVDEFLELTKNIPNRTRTLKVDGKPAPLWDNGFLLGLLVLLLSAEWAVRKYFKLL